MKNKLLVAAILYCAALLAVPCYIIYSHYDILSTGEIYKIEVGAYDPYDPFRGRYVDIRPVLSALRWNAESVQLIKDENDFVVDAQHTYNTNSLGYVKSLTIDRYYMNENTAPLVEDRQRKAVAENDLIYVIVKVKNGNYAIDGLYINGIAAEEYVKP